MVKVNDYCDAMNQCGVLLDSLTMMVEHSSKLLGFTSWDRSDEDENVTRLEPMAKEHFENLVRAGKQISSYADRFNNKLSQLKKVIESVKIPFNFEAFLHDFYAALADGINNIGGYTSNIACNVSDRIYIVCLDSKDFSVWLTVENTGDCANIYLRDKDNNISIKFTDASLAVDYVMHVLVNKSLNNDSK